MKDYYEVLDFVSETAPQLGNAKPALGVDIEAMGSGFGLSGLGYGDYSSNVKTESAEQVLEGGVNIAFVAGTVRGGEQDRMNRMIFRVTRGKALTYFKEFKQDGVARVVYMVVYQDGAIIRDRVQKICDSFMG